MSIARSMMTMRVTLERNAAATDAYGGPGKPGYRVQAPSVPCFVWSRTRARVMDDKKIAEVEEIAIIFPAATDVLSADRIAEVKDRRGRVLLKGPFEVIAGGPQATGGGIDHLNFKLRRVA